MFSKRKARLMASVTVAATLGGGLFVYMTSAATRVDAAPVHIQPRIDSGATPNWPSIEAVSEDGADAARIETDPDSNASASMSIDEAWQDGGYTYYQNR